MAKLTITFKYFSAFVNHAGGTTVFLPTAGHNAKISGTGIVGGPLVLAGTHVMIRNTSTGAVASGQRSPATGGNLTPITCPLPQAANLFDRGLLTAFVDPAVFNARFALPWGAVTDSPMQLAAFQTVQWDFGNGCRHRATDLVEYSYDLPSAHAYELAIGDTIVALNGDSNYTVVNGDDGADDKECVESPLEDPYPLSEVPNLVSALGLGPVQIPTAPLPAHLKVLLDQASNLQAAVAHKILKASPKLVEAFDGPIPLRLCQPCPSMQLDLP